VGEIVDFMDSAKRVLNRMDVELRMPVGVRAWRKYIRRARDLGLTTDNVDGDAIVLIDELQITFELFALGKAPSLEWLWAQKQRD